MTNIKTAHSDDFLLDHSGWRYYNSIKKKAMEQEFSWFGFLLGMSIAFFIVVLAAFSLNFLYQSLNHEDNVLKQKIFRLEAQNSNYLQIEMVNTPYISSLTKIS